MIDAIERIRFANADAQNAAAKMLDALDRLEAIERERDAIHHALIEEFRKTLDAIAGR